MQLHPWISLSLSRKVIANSIFKESNYWTCQIFIVLTMVLVKSEMWDLFCSFRDTAQGLINHQSHIWYLTECLTNNLITYGLRHNCKVINQDRAFIMQCQNKLDRINLEIQTNLVEKLKSELQEIKKLYQMEKEELILTLGNSELERIIGRVESEMNRNARKLEAIKKGKVTNLLKEQEKNTVGSGTGWAFDKRIWDSKESIETRIDNVRSKRRERCKNGRKNEYVIRKEEKHIIRGEGKI